MAKNKPNPILDLARSFDRARFDALVSETEPKVRSKIAKEGPSNHFRRLINLYGQDMAYTVYAAEKVMAKIIKRRMELNGEKLLYPNQAKEQARFDVAGKYRASMKAQTVVRPAGAAGTRWTHGFGGAGSS